VCCIVAGAGADFELLQLLLLTLSLLCCLLLPAVIVVALQDP